MQGDPDRDVTAKRWLERAKTAPLDVIISCKAKDRDSRRLPELPIISELTRRCSQWSSLRLVSARSDAIAVLSALPTTLEKLAFCELTTYSDAQTASGNHDSDPLKISAPALTRLITNLVIFAECPKLRHLQLFDVRPGDREPVRGLLRSATSLETLVMDRVPADWDQLQCRFEAPSLSQLLFTNGYAEDLGSLSRFLAALNAPKLSLLSLKCVEWTSPHTTLDIVSLPSLAVLHAGSMHLFELRALLGSTLR